MNHLTAPKREGIEEVWRIARESSDELDIEQRVQRLPDPAALHVRLHRSYSSSWGGAVRDALDCAAANGRCDRLWQHSLSLARHQGGFGDDWRGWLARLPTMPDTELADALEAIDDDEGCYLWGHGVSAWAAIEEAARRLRGKP